MAGSYDHGNEPFGSTKGTGISLLDWTSLVCGEYLCSSAFIS